MRGIALVLAAISAVAIAMPQFRLTAKEYEGFQRALDGRIPVAIASGRQLYTAVDTNADNFVVVDFGGAATSGEVVAPAPAPFDAPAPSPIIILDDVDLRSPEAPSFRSLDTVADDTVAAVDTPVIPAAAT
ncbi:unnamed protein product [Meganyctiphanes norvegica]|uniref:Uncharacterized protein n=1 Tax=Meganyctiphanes norvegica TaxID=48144 RepID=A0AAV2R5A1_MEGNR